MEKWNVGDVVLFGRKNGEQSKGVIVKVNLKSVKVKQVGVRGTVKSHADGTIWRVHPSFLRRG